MSPYSFFFFFLLIRRPPRSTRTDTLFPYTTLFRSPVHSQEALRIRVDTLELLGAMPPIAPALDAVIERFGTDAVAEVTGRTKRLVRLPDGSQKLQSRAPSASSEERRVGEVCGSTGRSRCLQYHYKKQLCITKTTIY